MDTNNKWGKIYEELGATPVINATGSVTLLGGSTPVKEVREAMELADSSYVLLEELEQYAGGKIAELLSVPAAYITSGAGSALTLASAAFMTGDNDENVAKLPNTEGMPNEILIQKRQRYWYDRCMEFSGARLVEVGDGNNTSVADFEKIISEKTAAIHVPVYEQQPLDENVLSLEIIIDLAKKNNIPVSVDSAGQIYPLENLGKYVRMGADFQCVAAKYMGAPHSTGFALGTEEIISRIAKNSFVGYETNRIRGIGRPHKIDRQEIVGVVTALERWMTLNHEDRLADFERKTDSIIKDIDNKNGIITQKIDNIIGHQPFGLFIDIDENISSINPEILVEKLKESSPSIWTRIEGEDSKICLMVFGLEQGQEKMVSQTINEIMKDNLR
ncbi:MAG: hypothetical protein CL774_04620 [Chloroflexi bacterium]|nr:hypothetical protein [Chloroflexota bacterium]|tara:strand:+ start:164 stop:1327 length:1164 start_codon:yes stop_codon:yes gene_type:complete